MKCRSREPASRTLAAAMARSRASRDVDALSDGPMRRSRRAPARGAGAGEALPVRSCAFSGHSARCEGRRSTDASRAIGEQLRRAMSELNPPGSNARRFLRLLFCARSDMTAATEGAPVPSTSRETVLADAQPSLAVVESPLARPTLSERTEVQKRAFASEPDLSYPPNSTLRPRRPLDALRNEPRRAASLPVGGPTAELPMSSGATPDPSRQLTSQSLSPLRPASR